jgi:phosphopantetheine adenylyltransferase
VPKSRNFSRWPVIYVYVHVEAIFQQEIIDGDTPWLKPLRKISKKLGRMLRKSLCSYLPTSVQTVTKSISITGKRNKDGTKYLVVILIGYETGRKPNLSHIRIFGWTAYAQIPQDERSKFVS